MVCIVCNISGATNDYGVCGFCEVTTEPFYDWLKDIYMIDEYSFNLFNQQRKEQYIQKYKEWITYDVE